MKVTIFAARQAEKTTEPIIISVTSHLCEQPAVNACVDVHAGAPRGAEPDAHYCPVLGCCLVVAVNSYCERRECGRVSRCARPRERVRVGLCGHGWSRPYWRVPCASLRVQVA